MRKLYENFHIFHFQKRKNFPETVRGNTECLIFFVSIENTPQVLCLGGYGDMKTSLNNFWQIRSAYSMGPIKGQIVPTK